MRIPQASLLLLATAVAVNAIPLEQRSPLLPEGGQIDDCNAGFNITNPTQPGSTWPEHSMQGISWEWDPTVSSVVSIDTVFLLNNDNQPVCEFFKGPSIPASALTTNDHDLGLKGSPTGVYHYRIFGTTKHNQTCSWDTVSFGVIAAATSSSPVATSSFITTTTNNVVANNVVTTTTSSVVITTTNDVLAAATNNVLTTTTSSVVTTTTNNVLAAATNNVVTTTTNIATTTSLDPAAQESSFISQALKWDTELSEPDTHSHTFLSDDNPSTNSSGPSNSWVHEIHDQLHKYNTSSIPGFSELDNIDKDLTELDGLDPSKAEWASSFTHLENDFEELNNTAAGAVFQDEINTVESHKHDFDNATDVAGNEEKWKALLNSLDHEFNSTTPDSVTAALTKSGENQVKDELHKFGIGFGFIENPQSSPSNFNATNSGRNATQAAEYMAILSNITGEYKAVREKLTSGSATWQQEQEEWNEFLKNLEVRFSDVSVDLSIWISTQSSETDFNSFFNAIGTNLTALESSPAMVVTSTSTAVATSTSIFTTTSSTAKANIGEIMLDDTNMVTSSSVVTTTTSAPVATPSLDPNAVVTHDGLNEILNSKFSSIKDIITSYINSMSQNKKESSDDHTHHHD